jgi:hypothetical protein
MPLNPNARPLLTIWVEELPDGDRIQLKRHRGPPGRLPQGPAAGYLAVALLAPTPRHGALDVPAAHPAVRECAAQAVAVGGLPCYGHLRPMAPPEDGETGGSPGA